MKSILDLLNQLSARTDGAISDAEAVALSDGLAELTDAIMRKPVSRPADLLDKIAVIKTCVGRRWDVMLPEYLICLEQDVEGIIRHDQFPADKGELQSGGVTNS